MSKSAKQKLARIVARDRRDAVKSAPARQPKASPATLARKLAAALKRAERAESAALEASGHEQAARDECARLRTQAEADQREISCLSASAKFYETQSVESAKRRTELTGRIIAIEGKLQRAEADKQAAVAAAISKTREERALEIKNLEGEIARLTKRLRERDEAVIAAALSAAESRRDDALGQEEIDRAMNDIAHWRKRAQGAEARLAEQTGRASAAATEA